MSEQEYELTGRPLALVEAAERIAGRNSTLVAVVQTVVRTQPPEDEAANDDMEGFALLSEGFATAMHTVECRLADVLGVPREVH